MKRIRHGQHSGGFSLIEALVVIICIVILVALFLPALPRPNKKMVMGRINCKNNLKQVGMAFRVWSLDHGGRYPMQVSITNGGTMDWVGSDMVYVHFLVMSNELTTPKLLWCPTDKRGNPAESFARSLANSNVNYFVGLDADETLLESFVSGDDNLCVSGTGTKPGIMSLQSNTPVTWSEERHKRQGQVGFADGHVETLSNNRLRNALAHTGVVTNQLAMP